MRLSARGFFLLCISNTVDTISCIFLVQTLESGMKLKTRIFCLFTCIYLGYVVEDSALQLCKHQQKESNFLNKFLSD